MYVGLGAVVNFVLRQVWFFVGVLALDLETQASTILVEQLIGNQHLEPIWFIPIDNRYSYGLGRVQLERVLDIGVGDAAFRFPPPV